MKMTWLATEEPRVSVCRQMRAKLQ